MNLKIISENDKIRHCYHSNGLFKIRACKQKKVQNPPVNTINDTESSSAILPTNDPDSSDEAEGAPFSRDDACEAYKE